MENPFTHQSDVLLDLERLKYLQKIYATDVTVGACMHVIAHHVVAENSIRLMNGDDEVHLEQHEQTRIEKMANDMLMQIVSWGFVVFTTSPRMRCVAISELASIYLRPGENELIGCLRDNATAKNVTIVNAFDASPLSDGSYTSMISKIVEHVRFKATLTSNVITIENQKVRPDIYCETEQGPILHENRGIIQLDGRSKTREERHSSNTFTQKERELNARRNQNYLDKMQDLERDAHDNVEGEDIPDTKLHAIPEGLKLSKILTSEGRSDYVQILRSISQRICAVFAVPRSMLINDSVARADTEATHAFFRIGLRRYRKHISHALSVCCSIVLSETIIVKLPDAYYGGTEELLKLYIIGAITFEKYALISRNLFNLQSDHIPEDPLTLDERKDVALECMKSMVTQHHGRT